MQVFKYCDKCGCCLDSTGKINLAEFVDITDRIFCNACVEAYQSAASELIDEETEAD